jgi:hypothetical protein
VKTLHLTSTQFIPRYCEELKVVPNVIIVKVGNHSNYLAKAIAAISSTAGDIHFAGDYYSLPNLVPMLSRPSRLELLMEILETPLPVRVDN